MSAAYAIRPRRTSDSPALLRVENAAAQLFRSVGLDVVADQSISDVDWLERNLLAGRETWVAVDHNDAPVGFIVAGVVGDYFHVHEISVDPAHGRKGIGAELMSSIIERARRLNKKGVSLTTFHAVPFNGPYYRRLGFVPFERNAPAYLRVLVEEETPHGTSMNDRILMVLHLA